MSARIGDTQEFQRHALFRRWLAFNTVGALGILVQLGALALFTRLLGWNYLTATAFAVEAAVLHNFVWHERWTWVERARGGMAAMFGRLTRFHLSNGFFSILGNVLLVKLFVDSIGMPVTIANLSAIAICSVLNFFAGEHLVFTRAT